MISIKRFVDLKIRYKLLLGVDLSRHGFIREQKQRKVGYIEYDWQNPSESSPRAKALYMTYFGPWNWIISARRRSTPGTLIRSTSDAALRSKVCVRGRPRNWSYRDVPV